MSCQKEITFRVECIKTWAHATELGGNNDLAELTLVGKEDLYKQHSLLLWVNLFPAISFNSLQSA